MMNPHRVVDTRPLDADLRLGPHYRPPQLATTKFAFAGDGDDFSRAGFPLHGCRDLPGPLRHGLCQRPGHPRGRALHSRPGALAYLSC